MSSESLPLRVIERAGSALEVALARIVARMSNEWRRELRELEATKRALLDDCVALREQMEQALDVVQRLALEAKGEQGPPGERGAAGLDGAAGRDGRDGLPGVPGQQGERGTNGRDGRDGVDGKDGLGIDDFSVERDGDRGIVFKLQKGDRVCVQRIEFPVQLYRGTYQGGRDYAEGDTVTHGGSQYVARRNTATRPPGDDWQLCVKGGLPGARGKDGEPGRQGERGAPGRDLTQLGADGRRW